MIKYEKDENGFIADSNLPDEQMVNFKLPKLIHGKIESFSYLTLEMEFKKQIKKLNNQFIICSLKEIEQVRDYLNQEDNQGNIIGMHFLSHSFELFLFDKKGATISREEYDFEYVSEKAGEKFFLHFKNNKPNAYDKWEKKQKLSSEIQDRYSWIFFNKEVFNNILIPIMYEENFELYEKILLEDKIDGDKPTAKKLKV